MFDGRVNKFSNFREVDDLIKLPINLELLHSQNRAVQIGVLASGQFSMKAGPHFEQATHASSNSRSPFSGSRNARKHFEQGRFTGAVAADHADDFAALHLKRNVLKRPDSSVLQSRRHMVGMNQRTKSPRGS